MLLYMFIYIAQHHIAIHAFLMLLYMFIYIAQYFYVAKLCVAVHVCLYCSTSCSSTVYMFIHVNQNVYVAQHHVALRVYLC